MAGSSVEHNSVNLFTIYKKGLFIMIYVGIDVAKEKYECLTVSSDENLDEIKIGLEETGHYCNNLEIFLTQKNFHLFIINPLFSSLHRKSISFCKTKTDKFDTRSIASMPMTQNLKPYIPVSYHKKELKSLARYRFRLVKDCSQLNLSFARLINLIFPKLESIVPQIQANSIHPSGQYLSSHAKMVTRGSKYLRYTLYTAAKKEFLSSRTIYDYVSNIFDILHDPHAYQPLDNQQRQLFFEYNHCIPLPHRLYKFYCHINHIFYAQ